MKTTAPPIIPPKISRYLEKETEVLSAIGVHEPDWQNAGGDNPKSGLLNRSCAVTIRCGIAGLELFGDPLP
jgi:hypothetical protein